MFFRLETFGIMEKTALFQGIEPEHYSHVLDCLDARVQSYKRMESIHTMGEKMTWAGLVQEGAVDVVLFNETGHQLSINRFGPGDVFGESFACLKSTDCPVGIHAVTNCKIVFLKLSALFSPQKLACAHVGRVTENLVHLLAEKNLFLNKKVQILAQKKIRDKIKIFLQTSMVRQETKKGYCSYIIQFNRDEMASYLGADRSALSRELCNMRDDGILTFQRNQIVLLDPAFLETGTL